MDFAVEQCIDLSCGLDRESPRVGIRSNRGHAPCKYAIHLQITLTLNVTHFRHRLCCVESQLLLNSLAPSIKQNTVSWKWALAALLINTLLLPLQHRKKFTLAIIRVEDCVSPLVRERIICYRSEESRKACCPFSEGILSPSTTGASIVTALPMVTNHSHIQLKSDGQKKVCKVGTYSHSRNKSKDKPSILGTRRQHMPWRYPSLLPSACCAFSNERMIKIPAELMQFGMGSFSESLNSLKSNAICPVVRFWNSKGVSKLTSFFVHFTQGEANSSLHSLPRKQ